VSALARAWAVCAKDATQELRKKVAIVAVFFFAATALALVSFGVGPFGLRAEDRPPLLAALLWIILFFAAATGLPRAFVAEEETGTGLALRKTIPAVYVLAGKTLFNYILFLAMTAVTIPGFMILLEWRMAPSGRSPRSWSRAGSGSPSSRPSSRRSWRAPGSATCSSC